MSADLVEDYTKFIALTLFPISIISNGIELIIWAVQGITALSYGASTLTYVFLGVLFGLSASVIVRNINERSRKDLVVLTNLVVFCGIATGALLYPSTLFSIAPHVDYRVHEFGFLIGTIAMLVYAKLAIFGKGRGSLSFIKSMHMLSQQKTL
jgi:membrane associated rhomboid family serine protease